MKLLRIILPVVLILMSVPASVWAGPMVHTTRCNGGNLCATGVSAFEFDGTLYNVIFAGDFYERFPDQRSYPLFWGNPDLAVKAATQLANVFDHAGIEMFYVEEKWITNGLFFATSSSEWTAEHGWGAAIALWRDELDRPVTAHVWENQHYYQGYAQHAVFEHVQPLPVPEPSTLALSLMGLCVYRIVKSSRSSEVPAHTPI